MIEALQSVVPRAREVGIEVRTLQVEVRGELVCDYAAASTAAPFRMYSVSKSITALAVLLLAEDGMLRLDDPIVAYFPEMGPVHPWLAQTTIDHMLAMVGPHARTTYDEQGGGWLESYFRVPPVRPPGIRFTYDTSASYVLAALVERLTGQSLLDGLRPRVLTPLGIGAGARFVTGPEGVSHGGSGLIIAPEDLLPLAAVIGGGGAIGGLRVLPERVVRRLVEWRSDPSPQEWGEPFTAGYGRQTWLPGDGIWMMFGMHGQVVCGDPARGVTAVATGDLLPDAPSGGDRRFAGMLLDALLGP